MFKQRKSVKLMYIAVISIILLCTFINAFAYEPFLDQIDRYPDGGDFSPEDYYQIVPNTIISSLDQGAVNVFSLTREPPGNYWPENASPFHWSQSDFVKIATAINQFAGKDQFANWNLLGIGFIADCEENIIGFSTGHFIMFRPIWKKGQLKYEAREIYINPLVAIVRWGDEHFFPRPIFGWNHINLEKFNYSAEEALKIAEENGGKELRFTIENKCQVSVIGKDNRWIVSYNPSNSPSEYTEYHIDPYTGKIARVSK